MGKLRLSIDFWIGLSFVLFGLFMVLWGIEASSNGEFYKITRRRAVFGDASLPWALCLGFCFLGVALAINGLRFKTQTDFTRPNWLFIGGLVGALGAAYVLTYEAMPVLVDAVTHADLRQVFLTTPWRQLPFIAGAFVIPATLISLAERRVTRRTLLISLLFTAALAGLYTAPFKHMVLPPIADL